MAGDFDDLRGQCNDADYRLDRRETEKEAIVQNSLEVAEQIINVLDDCNSSAERKHAVTIALQAYKAKTGQ